MDGENGYAGCIWADGVVILLKGLNKQLASTIWSSLTKVSTQVILGGFGWSTLSSIKHFVFSPKLALSIACLVLSCETSLSFPISISSTSLLALGLPNPVRPNNPLAASVISECSSYC